MAIATAAAGPPESSGGLVVSRRSGALILRVPGESGDGITPAMRHHRDCLGRASRAWNQWLTEVERDDWRAAGPAAPFVNYKRVVVSRGGYPNWVRFARMRCTAGLPVETSDLQVGQGQATTTTPQAWADDEGQLIVTGQFNVLDHPSWAWVHVSPPAASTPELKRDWLRIGGVVHRSPANASVPWQIEPDLPYRYEPGQVVFLVVATAQDGGGVGRNFGSIATVQQLPF